MSFKKTLLFLLLAFLLFLRPAYSMEQGNLILVIADNLSIYDLANPELTNLKELMQKGSIGLLNTNTAGKAIPENTFLTVAAGSRALGSSWSGRAYSKAETLSQFTYEKSLLTADELLHAIGISPVGSDEIAHTGIFQLQNNNSRLKYNTDVGALGDLLQGAGINTFVLGNSDVFSEARRFASLLTVNRTGFAGKGKVDREVLTKDQDFPFGFSTDYNKVFAHLSQNLQGSSFIVVDTGDLSRLEEYKTLISPASYDEARTKSLHQLDHLLGRIAGIMEAGKDLLILVSPTPGKEEQIKHNTLTPLIFYGKGIKNGLLISPSTRREGIVVNTDLSPTIVQFFGLTSSSSFVGRPISSVSAENNFNSLFQLNTKLVEIYNNRPVLLKTYIIMQIIFILAAIALLIFTAKTWLTKLVSFFIMYFLISTLLLIVFGLLQTPWPYVSLAVFLAMGLMLTALVSRLPISGLIKIQMISFLTSTTLLFDLLFDLGLMQNSPLGYDPIIGARFYGLGNELAGVLVGSTLLSASFFLHRSFYLKLAGILHLCLTAFVIFLPQYGADVGGLITATISFGYLLLGLSQKKSPAKLAIILPVTTLLLLFLVVSADFYLNKNNFTHMALTVSTIKQEGLNEAVNIMIRKINMNIKLLNYSIWTKALISFLLAFAILLARPRGFILRLKANKPALYHAFSAVLIASVIGLLVNDSGIIQAATTFIYLIFPLLYLAKNEEH